MLALGGAAALVLTAMNDTLVYFYTPSDLKTKHVGTDRRHADRRPGRAGLRGPPRRECALRRDRPDGDAAGDLPGVLPDLFREGQGVVTEGKMDGQGLFHASEVLAKHDENYMPKEVAEALKKSGQWQEEGKKP